MQHFDEFLFFEHANAQGASGEPSGSSTLLVGQLAGSLPAGAYQIAGALEDPEMAAVAWGLGAYRFRRYKSASEEI